MKKLLLAFGLLSLMTACSSLQTTTGTYSASFGATDARSSLDADYRYMGQIGGP